MYIISASSPEWQRMWDELKNIEGDYTKRCPETGEVWQYMGSGPEGHYFRHRSHPVYKRRHTIVIPGEAKTS